MHAKFDLDRFRIPLFAVVSRKDRTQPEMFSLLSDDIRLPMLPGADFRMYPLFTSIHQANLYAEFQNVLDGTVIPIENLGEFANTLHQLPAWRITHVAFDPAKGASEIEIYSVDEVLDAISQR